MPDHMREDEVAKADRLQKKGFETRKIVEKLQRGRSRTRDCGPSQSAVYRFLQGTTYVRNRRESRGRKRRMPMGVVTIANAERLKLIKAAKNNYLVTWADIHKSTKNVLKSQGRLTRRHRMPSEDWLARKVRERYPVRARPGKKRISRRNEHKKRRYELALPWAKYPSSWWTNVIHVYIDNKKFVCPRGEYDKKLLRATKVTHHLRMPSEGNLEACVLPKTGHMLLGVPSIEVTCAVARDRIIMWHVVEQPWNGNKAAVVYENWEQRCVDTMGISVSFSLSRI